ncbi:bcl-2-like protein 11 [Hippocampus zosterae]|uniref:bcl-2-like protein 11 n=1 Tax=Hippocampus zosterae TaxID=109293 RepID=UPI00223DC522|nr:bcl-2-like protein 11 [Hippocampus zosterae]
MQRSHGTAVTTEATAGRPRPQSSESRKEQQQKGSGVCSPDTEGGGAGGSPAAVAPRSQSRSRSSVPAALPSPERRGVFETRTSFPFPYRRLSSGYYSVEGDSLPCSPHSPHSPRASNQPPSPHALTPHQDFDVTSLERIGTIPRSSGAEIGHAVVRDMQAVAIGQDLRRIGDDYNDYILRRGRHRLAAARQNPPLMLHMEPAFVIGMGVLVLVIVWYLGGDPNSHPDHPQGIGYFKEL